MSDFVYSAVLILPAALRDAGNQLAVALGHDQADPPDTYSVALCLIGGSEPTHYGCHAWVTDGFKATIENAQQGQHPEGIDPELAAPVVAALIVSFQPAGSVSPTEHFNSVATAQGLERYVEADL